MFSALLGDVELMNVAIFRRRTPLPVDEDGKPVTGDGVSVEDKLNETLAGTAARNGKSGAAIIVMLPDVKLESTQNMVLPIILKWKVRVVENQLFNEGDGGTGLASSRLALHVAQFLQTRAFRGGNPLRCDPAKAIEEISLPGYLVHEINGECSARIALREKCAIPAIAQEGDSLALSCSTPAARIYYTLDQSYPGSGNVRNEADGSTTLLAQLYAEPITLEPGSHILRTAAEADGKQASNDAMADLTVTPDP